MSQGKIWGGIALAELAAGLVMAPSPAHACGVTTLVACPPPGGSLANSGAIDSVWTRADSDLQTRILDNHLAGLFKAPVPPKTAGLGGSGLAGGEQGSPYAVWASLGAGSVASTDADNQFDGILRNATLGFDYMPSDRWVVGLSPIVDNARLNNQFWGKTIHRTGYGLAPYGAYNFGQGTTVDAMLIGTWMNTDNFRSGVSGSNDGWRWTGAANLHHTVPVGRWELRGDLGYLYAHEIQFNYSDSVAQDGSSSSLSQGKVGGRVGYNFDAIEPYVQVHYLRDFSYHRLSTSVPSSDSHSLDNDPNEVDCSLGLDWAIADRVSFGAELTVEMVRANEKQTTGLINGRYTF